MNSQNVSHVEMLLMLQYDVTVTCDACMDVREFGLCFIFLQCLTNFSPFFFCASSTPADRGWHRYVWYYICGVRSVFFSLSLSESLSFSLHLLSLSESLSESALILPSIVPSPPITQNQEKHTPTRDWGSDKIKHTRWLIWITGARSIRVVRDSEPDRETWTGIEGLGRKENISGGKKNNKKNKRMTKEKRERTGQRGGLGDLFIIHQKTSCWNAIFSFTSPQSLASPLFNKKPPIENCAHISSSACCFSNV